MYMMQQSLSLKGGIRTRAAIQEVMLQTFLNQLALVYDMIHVFLENYNFTFLFEKLVYAPLIYMTVAFE